MSKIRIAVDTVGSERTPSEAMRRDLEKAIQMRANNGWTLRAMTSRGGSVYLAFARKEKGECQG